MEIKTIGVLGVGSMGTGITQASAQAGYNVIAVDIDNKIIEGALKTMDKFMTKSVEKGKLTAEDKAAALSRIKGSTNIGDLKDADFVVEAVFEIMDLKKQVFKQLDEITRKDVIISSNTSSMSITELAKATTKADKVVGMHFFNPVPVMKLVEVIRTIASDTETYEDLVAFAARLGKTPVRTSDRTGFIVNRLLVPYLLDAIRAFEEGVGSIVDIDNSLKLGCGHPMGPFTLLDFVGLDTTYYIANIMFDEFKERRFAPPALLKRMVLAGWNGRKSKRGFYDYADPQNPRPLL